MGPREYGFDDMMVMSNGHIASVDVSNVLLKCIPGAVSVHKSASCNDRLGVDWWVERSNGTFSAVDAKIRERDWSACHPDDDDLAIETFSIVETQKAGWSRDETKRCDYVLWFWKDTGRYCIIPFPMLCKVSQKYWEQWREYYRVAQQRTPWREGKSYHSECVFVPRKEVWARICETFAGSVRL